MWCKIYLFEHRLYLKWNSKFEARDGWLNFNGRDMQNETIKK